MTCTRSPARHVVATGRPGRGYPHPWALCRWVPGDLYDPSLVPGPARAGADLAAFVAALRARHPAPDAPPAGRAPLAGLDTGMRQALARCSPELGRRGVAPALDAWQRDSSAPA